MVPIMGQGSITHIIRTGMLDRLSEFCTPVVAMFWQEDDLIKELKQKGYEVTMLPSYKVSAEYADVRYKINVWYQHHKVRTPSISIQKKYLSQYSKSNTTIKKRLRESYHKLRFRFQPTYLSHLLRQEERLMQKQQSFAQYRDWLTQLKPDGMFTVTPFLPEVDLMARILKQQNLPLIASIHSFDNVTKRGWQSVVFDHYIVWNKYNKAELQRIHHVLNREGAITVAGAAQFDFHFDKNFVWSREEWLTKLGLPNDKKIILYSGGPVSLLPDEPQYLKALKEAFAANKIPNDYVVLFRCHPLDRVERWKEYVGESSNIYYDSAPTGKTKLDQTNVTNENIMKLMSTLKYSEVHINVVSTMSVDGSAFHKPQIGPYYDEVKPDKEDLFRQMYFQEHYRPIMRSNVINLAHSKPEFIELVNKALHSPEGYTTSCDVCLHEIITYTDGSSTNRAVTAIKSFFNP